MYFPAVSLYHLEKFTIAMYYFIFILLQFNIISNA